MELGKIRGFLFNPARQFGAAKGDSLSDAFKYFLSLLAALGAVFGIVVAAAVSIATAVVELPEMPFPVSTAALGPLLGAGIFVAVVAAGVLLALYISVWLHIWVHLFGGRKGLTQTVKAVTYGATPCLVLGWLPGPNILVGPILSLLAGINGVAELHELSPGMAILAVLAAILVPVLAVAAVAAVVAPLLLPC
ncbi:hypothetical protein B6V00_02370 [ANME-1 cluster archaeon ex4572_4]|nr:MAG: hypothetical protein B6V00_02370 [ANME-1 cluster archaeon ex4572_4]PXF51819.1 MAG: hypothetical protein C4B55_05580 [Methanophagales archaeon]